MTSKMLMSANGVGLLLLAGLSSMSERFDVLFGVLASTCVTLAGATLFFVRKWMAAREAFETTDLLSHERIEGRMAVLEQRQAVMMATLQHVDAALSRIEGKLESRIA